MYFAAFQTDVKVFFPTIMQDKYIFGPRPGAI